MKRDFLLMFASLGAYIVAFGMGFIPIQLHASPWWLLPPSVFMLAGMAGVIVFGVRAVRKAIQ